MSKEQMKKPITVALMRDLDKQFTANEISYSRMVEILNEKAKEFYSTPPQSVRTATAEEICQEYSLVDEYGKAQKDAVDALNKYASQFKPTPIANEEELRERIKQLENSIRYIYDMHQEAKDWNDVAIAVSDAYDFLSHAHELKPTPTQDSKDWKSEYDICYNELQVIRKVSHERKKEIEKLKQESKEVSDEWHYEGEKQKCRVCGNPKDNCSDLF